MEEIPRMTRLQGTGWLSQLPEDVLWMILRFLDLPTLYTVRLVCKGFRKSAAEQSKALDCTTLEELPTTDLRQFSGVTHFAVTASHQSHLQSLAHPRIAPIVTHVSLKGLHLRDGQSTEELEGVLMQLPKLRSVSLQPFSLFWEDARHPLFPITLEELKVTDRLSGRYERLADVGDASPLTRYSQLTSLAINLAAGPRTSMETLLSLRKLRSLHLCSYSSALGPLSNFTALTSLTWERRHSAEDGEDGDIFQDFGRLTGLSRLVLAQPGIFMYVTRAHLRCIAQLTNLTHLDMSGCVLSIYAGLSTALLPLTGLVSVRFDEMEYSQYVHMPFLSRLHSLTLCEVSDAAILQATTRLTHLDLHCLPLSGSCPWPAVAAMSRLRSLAISFYGHSDGEPVFRLDSVLRACTMLTKLAYGSKELRPDRDLEACASLPGLRSLSFERTSALTPAWLPALQAMSGLTELSVLRTGICAADMTLDVIAAFDAERRQMGWPLLKLRVEEENGRCFERVRLER